MTAKELFDILEQAVHDGYGDVDVLFDTEARTFDYHVAKIGSAYLIEDSKFLGRAYISLHEEGH